MNLFISPEEKALAEEFLGRGYVIFPVESRQALTQIAREVRLRTVQVLGGPLMGLDSLDVPRERLNELRLAVMSRLEACRREYYELAREKLGMLVGNELAMQRRISLSIQLPGDESSLLPLHADTWTGDSPFEVVLWVPLVDCEGTQSMYFRDHFVKIRYGEAMIFDLSVPHGNEVNRTGRARWSMNCRFKSVFSPYAQKRLGYFFEPITLKAATRAGLR